MARREPPRSLRAGEAREVHALYVSLADGGASRQVVGYASGVAGPLGSQGVALEVYRVRPKDLRDKRVLDAFRRRGIGRLPAALAGGRPLVGLSEIRGYYEARLLAPPGGAGGPRGRGAPAGPAESGPWAGPADSSPFGAAQSSDHMWAGPADDLGGEGSPEAELDDFFRQEMSPGGRGSNVDDTTFGRG